MVNLWAFCWPVSDHARNGAIFVACCAVLESERLEGPFMALQGTASIFERPQFMCFVASADINQGLQDAWEHLSMTLAMKLTVPS